MRKTWMAVLAALLLAVRAPAGEVELGAPVKFDFAGIKMALPKSFESVGTADRYVVVQALLHEADTPIVSLVLTAIPRGKGTKLANFVDAVGMDLSMNLAIRDLKIRKSKRLRVGGTEGEVQVQSYRHRGVEKTALRLFFLRPLPDADAQLAYLLTVEAEKRHGRRTLGVLIAVADTIELFDPISTITKEVDELGPPVVSRRLGYSFRAPAQWKAVSGPRGDVVRFFQFDYRLNGEVPDGQFRVGKAAATAEEYSANSLREHVGEVEKREHTYKIVRQGTAKIGGQDAYEWVIRHAPADAKPADTRVFGERTACANGFRYTLRLYCPGDGEKVVSGALAKIAGGMELFSPEGATTAPASAPAATAPGATAPTTQPASTTKK